jgi:exopolyphosphatase/guanosine-5'-triphosphate,3'-diphosphate pyrophosphatase
MAPKRLAAVDIGTNSIHLVIADVFPETGKFKILGREREMVRLGSGSGDMKFLSKEAIGRGLDTLNRYKALADAANAPVRAIATSAVREAINRNDFIDLVRDYTGIKVEVASGVEEARYIYLGVLQALPVYDKKILLIDIGGGSTEFLIGQHREIFYDDSIKLGAVRVTHKFFDSDDVSSKAVKDCRKYVKGMMNPFIREVRKFDFEQAVGCSGTVVSAAAMINARRNGEEEKRLNNFTFTRKELFEIVDEIIEAGTVKKIAKLPGLYPERADIILAGALVLEQIFKELDLKTMTVSEFALREGIILDSIEKMSKKGKTHLRDIKYKSVIHLAENFKYEKSHAHHVTGLALSIFDQTKELHKLGNAEREYLEAAAILHEIGNFVSHSQHHRHSYYLIRNSELLGFTENEKEIIANVARYHRKSHPKPKQHPEFAKLSGDEKHIVRKLASILRIADGLDRTHSSAVLGVTISPVEGGKGGLTLLLTKKPGCNGTLELEIWGAEQKKKLFEDTFAVNTVFETT